LELNIKKKELETSINEQRDYYKLCSNCGNFSHIKENHIHCSVCGTKLIEECPKCKTKIENPTAQFCVKCGMRMVDNNIL